MFFFVFPALMTVCLVWGYLYVSRVHKPLFQVASSETGAKPHATRPVIVLYDGICAFCDGFVAFCIANDPSCNILFAPLESPEGHSLRAFYAIPPETDSLIAIHCGHAVTHSTAALVTLMSLNHPISTLAAMLLVAVPTPVRDLGYSLFALVRYRLFGKIGTDAAACLRLSADTRPHFYTFPSSPSAVAASSPRPTTGADGSRNADAAAVSSPSESSDSDSASLPPSSDASSVASSDCSSSKPDHSLNNGGRVSPSSSATASASSTFYPAPLHVYGSSTAAAAASAARSTLVPSAPSPAALAALAPFLPPLLPPVLPQLPEPQVTPDPTPPPQAPVRGVGRVL